MNITMSLDSMMQLALNVARLAGDYARSQLGHTVTRFKADRQIVTDVDRHCQAMIIDAIKIQWPDHGFLGEEGDEHGLLTEPPSGPENLWWIIDPLDGSRNFAHGVPQFAVSLALAKDGVPVLGVIYEPNTNMMFAARQGQPAQCNGRPIHCLAEPLDINSQLAVPGHYYGTANQGDQSLQAAGTSLPARVGRLMQEYVCINLGSAALHYAYVAAGAYAASFAETVKLWDIAAGAIIAQSAGARVTDLNGKPIFPLDCAAYQGQPLPILIAAPIAQQKMLDMLNATP